MMGLRRLIVNNPGEERRCVLLAHLVAVIDDDDAFRVALVESLTCWDMSRKDTPPRTSSWL